MKMQKRSLTISNMAYPARVLLASVMIALSAGVRAEAEEAKPPNVLFIAVDDLRPELKSFGQEHMVTPHMDALAQRGRAFSRHYVEAPTCGAARYALLTGQYPKRNITYSNAAFRLYQDGVAPPSFPQIFRENGYHTVQMGKVSHSPDGLRDDQDRIAEVGIDNTYNNAPHKHFTNPEDPELPGAWDVLITPVGKWQTAWGAFFAYDRGETRRRGRSAAVEAADVDDTGYPDGLMAERARQLLGELGERDEPFFFAVGFYKPHLPFNAPQKYWDLYERDAIDISHVDPLQRRGGEMINSYGHSAEDFDDEAHVRKILHGYYAATSYVDAQIGKVLDALDETGLAENTIVVLWGDHGFHLGENGIWGKHSLHEQSLRSPLIVRVPGMPRPGEMADGIVASVDIYPTLMELANLPMPEHLDGQSFAAMLEDPKADPIGFAVGFNFPRGGPTQALRVDGWRYIQGDGLYDRKNDPNERENVAEAHPELVERMQAQLQEILDRRKAR